MKVVGVGCGPGMMTEEAAAAVSSATLIMGSTRALELASAHIPPDCDVQAVADFASFHPPDNAIVLSTGDPMFAGLGYLGGEIIPGISSLQVAASRLRVPIETILVIMAHGKDHERAFSETRAAIDQGRHAFIVTDPKFSTVDLAAALIGAGNDLRIIVCEDLGYPEERIVSGPLERPPRPLSRLFCVLAGRFPDIF
jgi:cobalt-precorrin-7 (C5)-methyltransferase